MYAYMIPPWSRLQLEKKIKRIIHSIHIKSSIIVEILCYPYDSYYIDAKSRKSDEIRRSSTYLRYISRKSYNMHVFPTILKRFGIKHIVSITIIPYIREQYSEIHIISLYILCIRKNHSDIENLYSFYMFSMILLWL